MRPRRRSPSTLPNAHLPARLAALAAAALLALPADAPLQAGPPEPGPTLAVAELRGASTLFWAVDPAEPRRRARLGEAAHKEGWGVRAAPSPNGRAIAYLALPPGAREPSTDAELWVLDTATGAERRLAAGLDLVGTPVWSPDGAMVAARRTHATGTLRNFELLGYPIDAASAGPALLAHIEAADWAGALGWTGETFVYAVIDANGTRLHVGDAPPLRLHGGIAREVTLGAGGTVSFVAPPGPGQPAALQGRADLWDRRVQTAPLERGEVGVQVGQARLAAAMPAPQGGAVAGRLLQQRDGGPVAGPLAVADAAGAVRAVRFAGYAEAIGWLP